MIRFLQLFCNLTVSVHDLISNYFSLYGLNEIYLIEDIYNLSEYEVLNDTFDLTEPECVTFYPLSFPLFVRF